MKPNPPMIQVLLHCNFVNLNYRRSGLPNISPEVIPYTNKKRWATKELLKEMQ